MAARVGTQGDGGPLTLSLSLGKRGPSRWLYLRLPCFKPLSPWEWGEGRVGVRAVQRTTFRLNASDMRGLSPKYGATMCVRNDGNSNMVPETGR